MNIKDGRSSLEIKGSNGLTVGLAAKEGKGCPHKEETETAAVSDRQRRGEGNERGGNLR